MMEHNNIPKLRFPKFNGAWQQKKLGDLMNFKVTNSFSRDNLNYENGTVKNIHYGDIHTKFCSLFYITKEKVPFVNNEIPLARISDDFYCKDGDLVFADASEDLNDVGKSIEIIDTNNEKLLAGLHTILARAQAGYFFLGFKAYLFSTPFVKKQIQKQAQGTKVLSISASRILTVKLNFPSLDEQASIACFFASIDERIQNLKKKKDLLEEYKKGVMQRLFSQELRFRDDNGDEFPDWELKKLGEVSERITLKNKENNSNVLTISAQLGLVSQLEFFNKSVSAKDVSGYYLLNTDNFAYNKSYSNGYPMGAIKRLKRYSKGVVSTLYICFKFMNRIDLNFMEQYFEMGLQNVELEKVAQEGARNHGLLNIGIKDFFDIELKLPMLSEQIKIANFLASLDKKIESIRLQIQKTETWKKGLLQQMFV